MPEPRVATIEEELARFRRAQPFSVISFLQAGRASHPDEAEPQAEYDLMLRAVKSGLRVKEALEVAQSHLDAHRNALRPEMRGTVHDPYPGQPGKNRAAVAGFVRVVAALHRREEKPKEGVSRRPHYRVPAGTLSPRPAAPPRTLLTGPTRLEPLAQEIRRMRARK